MMIVQKSCTILQISKYIADKVGGDAMVAEKVREDVMDSIDRLAPESGTRGAQAGREELAERVRRVVHEAGTFDVPGGLRLLRAPSPTELEHGVSFPAFCVVAQGSKEVLLGDELYRYDSNHYLIT